MLHPAEIKAGLEKAGFKQIELAKQLNISCGTLHKVIYGEVYNPKVRAAIALILEKPVEEIFASKHHNLPKGLIEYIKSRAISQ